MQTSMGGVNVALSRQIYVLFFEETEKDLGAIKVNAENAEWDEVSLLAHRIRGRARIMEFGEFEGLCTELERYANDADKDGALAAIVGVSAALLARKKEEQG